jgi:hypothetical protein
VSVGVVDEGFLRSNPSAVPATLSLEGVGDEVLGLISSWPSGPLAPLAGYGSGDEGLAVGSNRV